MNLGILLLCLSSLQTVNVKASFLHVQNNLIGKINAIILIIVIEDIIAIFMQLVMNNLENIAIEREEDACIGIFLII